MQKIVPHLWFDREAEEAANFYATLFDNSRVGNITRYGKAGFEIHGQPEGKVMTVEFQLAGQDFIALNGGPAFQFTPAVSFLVGCASEAEVNTLWEQLSHGGSVLMELGEYPFSKLYGWVQDRYGLSWQVMLVGDREIRQKITPSLMFVGEQCGKAEQAIRLYTSVFQDARIGDITRHGKGEEPDREGTLKFAAFTLEGQDFAAMDSAHEHNFTFNEAISFLVRCESQAEIDHFWDRLGEGGDPGARQCGWLKDRFGLSWQISPTVLDQMLQDADTEKVARVTDVFLQMKKLDIEELKRVFEAS